MLGQKFVCEFTVGEAIGQLVIWIPLIFVTLGLAYLVYWSAVIKRLLNAVELKPL